MEYNKHYIRLDSNNYIIEGFSDAFEQPQENDICINVKGGRHFELNGEFNPGLHSAIAPRYKYVDGNIVELTEAEIKSYRDNLPNPPVSTEEKISLMQQALDEIILGGINNG